MLVMEIEQETLKAGHVSTDSEMWSPDSSTPGNETEKIRVDGRSPHIPTIQEWSSPWEMKLPVYSGE